MFDAETGEEITFTKAKWNGREGRVNLDYRGILLQGTGALAIKESDRKAMTSLSTSLKSNEENLPAVPTVSTQSAVRSPRSPIGRVLHSPEGRSQQTTPQSTRSRPATPPDIATSNPLVQKFLNDGPLNPMFHTRWNPKTGKIDPLPVKEKKRTRPRRRKAPAAINTDFDDDDDESNHRSLDPNDFLNQKTSIANIVDMALLRRSQSIGMNGENNGTPTTESIRDRRKSVRGGITPSQRSRQPSVAASRRSSNRDTVASDLSTSEFDSSDSANATDADRQRMLEENIFNQLFAMANEADNIRNPKPYKPTGWTRAEKERHKITEEDRKMELIRICEEAAALKAKISRELKQAIADEEAREKKRSAVEAEMKNPRSKYNREVIKKHNEERERARIYIRSLQYDNEVLFISKMKRVGLIW